MNASRQSDDFIINSVLLNLINKQFANDLNDFRTSDGRNFVTINDKNNSVLIELHGKTRAFKKVNSEITESGFKALAFREVAVDSQKALGNNLYVLFPGLSDTNDSLGKADEHAAHVIIKGQRSPQVDDAEIYYQKHLQPYLKSHPEVKVSLFAHSIGAANALAVAQHVPASSLTLFEPLGASQAVHHLNLPDQDIIKLQNQTVTIRSYPPTFIAGLKTGNEIGNRPFGKSYYVIDSNRHAASAHQNEARQIAVDLATLGVGFYADKLNLYFHDDGHDTPLNARILHNDPTALKLAADQHRLATLEQIKHPGHIIYNPLDLSVQTAALVATGR